MVKKIYTLFIALAVMLLAPLSMAFDTDSLDVGFADFSVTPLDVDVAEVAQTGVDTVYFRLSNTNLALPDNPASLIIEVKPESHALVSKNCSPIEVYFPVTNTGFA